MANIPSPAPPLTSRIERVLAFDGPPFGRVRPTPTELHSLLDLLAQGPAAGQRLNLARAVQIVADVAPDERTARLVARLLRDPASPLALRLHAAAALGELPLRSAAQALAESLDDAPSGLEPTLLKALAQVGDAEGERAIARRPATAAPRLSRLRAYARAAIRLRAGTPLDGPARQAVLPAGVRLALRPAAPDQVKAVLARYRGARWGLEPSPDLAWQLRCGGADHLLMLAAALAPGRRREWLRSAPRIAGLLAMDDAQHHEGWRTRRIIATEPQGEEIRVSVLRPDGDVELLGRLRPQGEGFALELQSLSHSAAPMRVEGLVSEDAVRLQVHEYTRAARLRGDVDPAAG